MKKLVAAALTLCMTFGLAACGAQEAAAPEVTEEVVEEVAEEAAPAEETDAESDMAYVQEKGVLVVGITDFEPMDYKDDSGNWIGFDADMAAAFAKSLGVEVEFIEIEWDNKINDLNTKTIDCVWNGMTLTDDVKKGMGTSNAYCNNAQVVVVKKEVADTIKTVDDIVSLKFAVEDTSAGQEQLDALKEAGKNIEYVTLQKQADALMEVQAGTSDACVIDLLMAGAMIGEGTSYPNLVYTIKLNDEQYGVGFRKDSDLVKALNDFMKKSYEDGSMMDIAKTYGVQESLIAQ